MSVTTAELNELMKVSARDGVDYMRNVHQQNISLCQQDLTAVDMILTKLAIEHIKQPLTDKDLFTLCSILGAIVGETFKQARGGEWFMDESVPNAPFVVLNYAGKSFPFASVCYEKIVKTPEINIAKYYELALGGATN
ncbi:MAG: hypothetical protein MJK04_02300 [Psychrosphaera sp.]|nr:hypothetical protein [Psychrosphaera sp.]